MLEGLDMRVVDKILSKSRIINIERKLQFPKSLKELTYICVSLGITTFPQSKPLLYPLRINRTNYHKDTLYLTPHLLPNLNVLIYRDSNPQVGGMSNFFDLNPNVDYVN
ncbi:hypothetical protein CONCODRAFT_13033 [Conidiobolus coronatus NRRL 28638]|uniref:Uncharacterized protein n=1 Tax=Conidiobolus coronatus (strain ATCC 28846 / CBS 209.66 / NRRL 28638) TaxID=796925 RepID=A0A137NRI6_CONC2|nr:hypothetical protein CONCODRAFT_13033 [Conidiobolus coronatus NRRL 28638]|eukprot:KXN65386.1 hypothetical protein CONCODRAFT_13033 [Conidiobolus coronatus NRRL 28638]